MSELARLRTTTTGYDGGPGVNTVYMRNTSGSGWTAIPNQLIAQVDAAWQELIPLEPASWSYHVEGTIDIIDAANGELLQTIVGTGTTEAGSGQDGYGPLASGLCVTFHTAGVVNSHHVRARQFIVPVGDGWSDSDGSPTGTALGYAQAFGDALAATGSYGKLVAWSRPVKDGRAGSNWDVTTATTKGEFCVLRSRRN